MDMLLSGEEVIALFRENREMLPQPSGIIKEGSDKGKEKKYAVNKMA